ncbi:MAG: hypothetical protein ACYST3_09695 [Planctomycetota bacterium]
MTAKRTNKAKPKMTVAHRINESLAGGDLFTMTLAVFIFLGLFAKNSKGVRPGAITSFYNSGAIIRHHSANGNFEKVDGRIKLTAKGRAHFGGRYANDSAQYVEKSDAGKLAKFIKSGNVKDMPDGWANEVTTMRIEILK